MMGQLIWASSIAAVVAFCVGLSSINESSAESATEEIKVADAATVSVDSWSYGTRGSALATAAWGMSALRPETYNGEIVIDILQASPLSEDEKDSFEASLAAAEAGRADLDDVLADIRVALAVE